MDVRRTESARIATRHLAPRPGTDYALLGFLVRELLEDGADRGCLAEHARNVEALAQAVARFELAEAARITGLPDGELADVLSADRRHGRLVLQTGIGTSMAPTANVTQWLALALLAVTGSFERPGGIWFNPGFVQGLDRRLARPDRPPGPGPPSRPDLGRQGGEYPAITIVDELEAGNLRALFVLGGNLLVALPDAARVRAALEGVPVVAVSDVQRGQMVEHATHVLAAAGPLERADLPHFSDCLAPTMAAQNTAAAVPVGADRRSGWWPLAALAERLGRPILPEGLPLGSTGDDDLLRRRVRPASRADFEELVAAGGPLVDADRALGWVERNVLPDGRWDLVPEPLVHQLDRVPAPPPLAMMPLAMIPCRQRHPLNSYALDLARADSEPAEIVLHPADAAEAGVADGDRVRVESGFRGLLAGTARVDESIRRGAVAIPHGWEDPNVSTLLSASEGIDPLTGMPTYCGVPITVAPVEEPAAAERAGSA